MKMTVEFWTLSSQAEPIKVGSLVWNGREFRTDSPRIRQVLDEPVVLANNREIHAIAQPELFMRNLHRHYRSAYFTAAASVTE